MLWIYILRKMNDGTKLFQIIEESIGVYFVFVQFLLA
jgi:hypothetical protein